MKKIIILLITVSSLAAGEVLPNGSYSHSIEIQVAPGTNGMQPKLSLNYNSNGGNGILGVGFSLQGLPVIKRDNFGRGVNYDGQDTYFGPAGRLVDISGNGTVYHSEQESFTKFEAIGLGTSGDGPGWWVATDAAGIKYRYGGDGGSSQVRKQNSLSVREWALDTVTDLNGNYMHIEYYQYAGAYYPKSIVYTLNDQGGIGRYRVVEFEYENRPDIATSYAAGSNSTTLYRMSAIVVKTNVLTILGVSVPFTGDLVRRYVLSYDTSPTGFSRLVSVQEFGNDGSTALPAQVFGWQGNSTVFVSGQGPQPGLITGLNDPNQISRFVDLNGDGFMDIVRWDYVGTAYWCLGQGNYFYYCDQQGGLNIALNTPGGTQMSEIFDINGDGLPDLVRWDYLGGVYWNLGTGSGFLPTESRSTPVPFVGDVAEFADLNGDGLPDIIRWRFNGNVAWCLNTGSGFANCDTRTGLNIGLNGHNQISRIMDINGDGLADLIRWDGSGGVYWNLGTGSGFGPNRSQPGVITALTNTTITQTNQVSRMVDLNADGIIDLVRWDYTGVVYSCLGTGDGFTCRTPQVGLNLALNELNQVSEIQDMNYDGYPDLLRWDYVGTMYWNLGGPNGFGQTSSQSGLNIALTSQYGGSQISRFVDLNGDGLIDLARWDYIGGVYSNRSAQPGPDRMVSVTAPSGGRTDINYVSAPNVANAVRPDLTACGAGSGVGYGQPCGISNASPRRLVTQITSSDGRGASYTTTYNYFNGRQRPGTIAQRKDLGFQIRKVIRPDGQNTFTYVNQSDPDLDGAVIQELQYGAPGSLMAFIRNEFIKINPFPGTKMTLPSRKVAIAYDNGYETNVVVHQSVIDMSYDAYGFLSQRTTSTTGYQPIVEKLTIVHDVVNNIFGRTTDGEVYLGSLAGPKLSHERTIFNGMGGACANPAAVTMVCEKQAWLDRSKDGPENRFLSTRTTYTNYGLTLSVSDSLNHATTYAYDSDYQTFPIQVTNAKGHVTTRTYDARYGIVLTETDQENGVSASQEYDVFGRLAKVRDTSGNVVKQHLFVNAGNPNAQYAELRLTDDSADGYQWAREYMDGLGRVYRKEGEGLGVSAILRADITFDLQGRKASETNTYASPGGAPRVTSYTYDSRSRIASIIYPEDRADNSGKVRTVYAYGTGSYLGALEATTTATDAKGNSKTIHKDARGQVVRIDDPAGATIRHSYDYAGRLTQTIDADNNYTTIEYDSIGRKIRMVEPNSGTMVYRYDDGGNLVEQVDGKGQQILFTYDELNRVTLKNLPGTETDVVYEYDSSTSTFGKRRLSKVTDAAGTIEYNYDNRGNMSAWKRTIDSYAFSFQATYDTQNRLQQLTYPDGYKSRNYFSDAGHIRQVRLLSPNGFFGSSLVTYQGPETTGQAEILRNLGNGVVTKIGFDDATRRPNYIRTYLKNDATYANPVQNLAYSYDDIGNITQITDNVNAARSESFTYDSLYRLTQATSGMYGTKNYSFTAGGNLTQNGGTQLYYGGSANCTSAGNLPTQAVCADSAGNQYAYDLSGNMIKREGRDLEYDSEDRLTAIKESGATKLSFVYNHAGERIKKIRPDGAITYSIGGLYEVQKKPNGTEVHTKYFTGVKGDRIAQVTKDSSTVTLAAVTTTSTQIYLASGQGAFLVALGQIGNTIGYLAAQLVSDPLSGRYARHVSLFLIVIIGGLGFVIIRARGPNAFAYWRRATVMPALVCFLSVVFIDCSGSSPADNGTTWETTTGSTTGIPTLNTPAPTYNDASLAGMPVTGTFFLVPNHLGSTTLVTDASGTSVISETHYEPYGEIVTSHSSGPDIIRNTYTGQVKDVESSLMYYGARYYDPKLGRFVSADTVVPDASDSQGYNRYLYVAGNPVHYSDPTGNFWWAFFAIILIGVGVPAILAGTRGNVAGWLRGDIKFDLEAGWKAGLAGGLAAGLGALAGASLIASYGGASAVAGSFWATVSVGFASGAAAGFAGGSASAWLAGGNFLEGLAAGFQGMTIGALGGAVLAGAGWWLGEAFTALVGSSEDVALASGKAPPEPDSSSLTARAAGDSTNDAMNPDTLLAQNRQYTTAEREALDSIGNASRKYLVPVSRQNPQGIRLFSEEVMKKDSWDMWVQAGRVKQGVGSSLQSPTRAIVRDVTALFSKGPAVINRGEVIRSLAKNLRYVNCLSGGFVSACQ